jgi:hypothetical protein
MLNLIKFLKPNVWKILIFIFIFVFMVYIFALSEPTDFEVERNIEHEISAIYSCIATVLLLPTGIYFLLVYPVTLLFPRREILTIEFIIMFILNAIYLYIIACAIYYLFKYIKTKIKKYVQKN